MEEKKKSSRSKIILRSSMIGAVIGLMMTVIYIVIGILFQETIFDGILYCISVFFAFPFGFLAPLLEGATDSYVGTMIGFAIASLLGGLLYGFITGCILSTVILFKGGSRRV